MDVGAISSAISNVGFPIACCIYLIYSHKQEIQILANAIDNNTKAIDKLERRLERNEANERKKSD